MPYADDSDSVEGNSGTHHSEDPSRRDTASFRRYTALGVYNNEVVLNRLERILGEIGISMESLRVGEQDDVDFTSHPKLSRSHSLYLLPLDYELPRGGMTVLKDRIRGGRIVMDTDKPAEAELRPIGENGRYDFELFGYVRTPLLDDAASVERYKEDLLGVLEDPLNVFILAPIGFEEAKKSIMKRLTKRLNPWVDDAETWEKALEKLSNRKYDRIYLPEGLKGKIEEIKEAHHEPRCFFFKRTNGICTFYE